MGGFFVRKNGKNPWKIRGFKELTENCENFVKYRKRQKRGWKGRRSGLEWSQVVESGVKWRVKNKVYTATPEVGDSHVNWRI